jgi:recombination protein RecA
MYSEGISLAGDILETGLQYGVVNKSGNSYSYNDEKLGVGLQAAKTYLKDNPKMAEEIKKKIWEAVKAKEE